MTVRRLVLQRHPTPGGVMIPIYHDYNTWNLGYVPKMCYATTMAPGTSKDVILHQRRTAYLTAITGNVILLYADPNVDTVHRVYMNIEDTEEGKDTTWVTMVEPNTAISLVNTSNKSIAVIVNLPSPAWHPDDEDTTKFKGWQEYFSWRKLNSTVT